MKSIEIFNETNSNLNKAVNMAFEVTLRKLKKRVKLVKRIFKKIFKVQKLEMVYAIILKKKVIFV